MGIVDHEYGHRANDAISLMFYGTTNSGEGAGVGQFHEGVAEFLRVTKHDITGQYRGVRLSGYDPASYESATFEDDDDYTFQYGTWLYDIWDAGADDLTDPCGLADTDQSIASWSDVWGTFDDPHEKAQWLHTWMQQEGIPNDPQNGEFQNLHHITEHNYVMECAEAFPPPTPTPLP